MPRSDAIARARRATRRRASFDLGAWRRTNCFWSAHADSIGLKSGEYGGKVGDHLNATRRAEVGDARVVVSGEVVHDHDVAAPKLGQQLRPEPPDEGVPWSPFRRSMSARPTRRAASRRAAREVLAPVHWHAVDELSSHASPTHGYGLVERLRPDSSRNTRRSNGIRRIFIAKCVRLNATSGR